MSAHVVDVRREREDARRRAYETLNWLAMMAVAVFIFELTADPSLPVVVGCLKFGTPEFKIARWLRRADPDRVRGRTCSLFYVTLAIMRIGLIAICIIVVLTAVLGQAQPQVQIMGQMKGAWLVILSCIIGAAMASWIAVGTALGSGVRVWMDATAILATRERFWPPLLPDRSRRARFGLGVIAAYAILAALGLLLALFLLVAHAGNLGPAGFNFVFVLCGLCAVPVVYFSPGVISQIEAVSPSECYGDQVSARESST
jgi:hypothetical protein